MAFDGSTIVVGSLDEDGPGNTMSNAGAVYVFERTATGWEETALLRASDAANLEHFGSAIALDNDTLVGPNIAKLR